MAPILSADREAVETNPLIKPLKNLLREMGNKDMAGGCWYNELHRIIEEGK